MSKSIKEVKHNLNSKSEQERLAALSETLNYGQEGLELLIEQSLKDSSERVKQSAYWVLYGDNPYLNGNPQKTYPTDTITSLAISSDNTILVGGSWKIFWVWNLQSGEIVRTIEGHSHWILSVVISPDGNTLVTGSADKTIKVWNLTTGQLIHTLSEHSSWVTAVVITPDGKSIVSGSADKTIKIWDLNTGKLSKTLKNEKGLTSILSLCISFDGKVIASGSTNNKINLWSLDSGQVIRSLEGHSDWIQSLTITSDNTTLVSGSRDGAVKFWQSKAGEQTSNQSTSIVGKGVVDIAATAAGFLVGGPIVGIGAWLIGRAIVNALDNKDFSTLPVQKLECTKTSSHSGSINSLACHINQNITVVGYSKNIKIFDLKNSTIIHTLPEQPGFISSVAVSPNGKNIVIAGKDWVILLNSQTVKPLHTIKGCSYPRLSKLIILESPQELFYGQSKYFTLKGLDENSKDIILNDKDIQWEASGGKIEQGLFTAGQREGTFKVKAKIGIFEASVPITILEPARIAKISITPSNITLEFGKVQQFTAKILDQRGNPMQGTVLWEVKEGGTIDQNGKFLAGREPGKFEIIASVGSIRQDFTITIIEPPKLDKLIITSSIPQLEFGKSFQFRVKGVDQYGGNINIGQVTWSTNGGSILNDGTFCASYQEETITVTATLEKKSVSAYVNVIKPSKLTKLLILPKQVEIEPGQYQQFNLQGLDQRGCEIAVGQVVWKATGGTINQNGNFIADSNAKGKFRVTATVNDDNSNFSVSIEITIVPVLKSLYIFPNEVALKPEENFTFDVIGLDQKNDPIQINQVHWQCSQGGRINGNGTFIGGYEKREVTVSATVKGISESAKVTLLPVLRRLEIYPQKVVKFKPDEVQNFTAVGLDQYGNRIDTGEIFWEATGGKIDRNGKFTASHNAKGAFKVRATVSEIRGSGVRANLLILGIYMRILYRVFSFVNFNQSNFIFKSSVELVKTNFTTDEQTENIENTENIKAELVNEETDHPSFDLEAWLQKNILNILFRMLDLGGQVCIKAAKISADIEFIVVPVLRRLEIYPKEAQLQTDENITFSALGFDQQGERMILEKIMWNAASGNINSEGKFIAGKSIGKVKISAIVGEIYGSTFIIVVERQELIPPPLTPSPEPPPLTPPPQPLSLTPLPQPLPLTSSSLIFRPLTLRPTDKFIQDDEQDEEEDFNSDNFDNDTDEISIPRIGYNDERIIYNNDWFYRSQLFYDGYTISNDISYQDYLAYVDARSLFEYLQEE